MTGGTKSWKTEPEYLEGAESVSANQENQLWLCSGRNAENAVNGHGRMTLLTDMPSDIERTLMSDPQTLLGFINYAAQRYPAQRYDLILWKEARDRDYGEIYRYQEQFGLTADITGLSASDWDIYISTIIDLLNKYSDVDTETWLALLTAQQSSQVVQGEKATAVGVDRTGDGVEDAYRVTTPVPLNLVRDVYTRLGFELAGDEGDEEWEFFKMFLGLPDTVDIAKVHGNPVQEEIVNYLSWGADLGSGVRSLFAGTDCAYELPTTVDRWYEILDSDGIGHVISVDEVDLGKAQDLRIPVIVHFAEPRPDGSDWREDGYLIYGNGHFKGFQSAERFNPLISLNNSAFYGATIQTAALLPANVFGYSIELFTEISDPFALPEQRDGDGGMKLVMTPMADIKDLADTQLTPVTMLVDLYGQGHDISTAIQAAREASAAGNVTYSIEAARITVPDAVFNRRLQMPEVTVKLGDKELVADEDYERVAQEMLKAGTQELKLFGRGDYVGYTTATFTILPAESKVEALEAVALSDLANGDVTVLTVDTPAHPDNVQFDFSGTDERLRKYLKEGADGKTVVLEKGAEAGTYEIRVNVIDGGEDTYAHAAAVVSGRAGEAKGLRPKGQAQIHLAVLQAVDHRHRLRGVLHRLRAVELLHRAGGHPLLWHPLQYLCPVGSEFRVLQRLCGLCRV